MYFLTYQRIYLGPFEAESCFDHSFCKTFITLTVFFLQTLYKRVENLNIKLFFVFTISRYCLSHHTMSKNIWSAFSLPPGISMRCINFKSLYSCNLVWKYVGYSEYRYLYFRFYWEGGRTSPTLSTVARRACSRRQNDHKLTKRKCCSQLQSLVLQDTLCFQH